MTTLSKYVVALFLCLFVSSVSAQETEQTDVKKDTISALKLQKIKNLERLKEDVKIQEREYLKAEIEAINNRLDNDEITADEAEKLKKEAAKKRAANIEDRLAIIDKKIELVKRNPYAENLDEDSTSFVGFLIDGKDKAEFGISIKSGKRKPPKYDIRTSNRMVFAIGFNNAIGDGQNLDNTPYKLGGSGFVELGWAWQTRLFAASNFARLNYGFSFQWNKFDIKNNQYFVENGDQTTLQDFPLDLKNAKFRVTNLVFPVHLEFGPSEKKDYGNRIRYFTDDHFRVGIGGYGGVRLGSMQKLVYEDAEGDRVKDKQKRNFNASNFVYGLSGYIGWGDWSIYAKYDLSPLFKDQAFDQNNISLGLRWDLD
ncbi:hypothetical protein [Winogradskyella jejuensis]|uniref:Outer membrane protein beta-barrel domain-containing protein n=1 Tax=Winogradskyella jejuensis TaxID=1089305 RepID=A0A1M5PIB0_9FLAO|nr:hypothetical protein [Winogradskyella jejuensis]SHH01470.1 hypothetical protein SAMN05444148_1496 [Winogradskyella jejuensis]